MLVIEIPEQELFDRETREFYLVKAQKLRLEHSLISASLWESKWKRCFLEQPPKELDEIISYIECMLIDKNVDPKAINAMTQADVQKVMNYISDSMTATTINPKKDGKSNGKREIMTTEVIYAYMAGYSIPFTCEKWHLNRLIMLIQVCSELNKTPEKMSKNDIYRQNRSLNAARRAKLHSKG